MKSSYKILLLEKNYNKALEIQKHLAYNDHFHAELVYTPRFKEALSLLSKMVFDALLLDTGIKKTGIQELIKAVKACRGDIPIITLIDETDETQGIEAIRHGAQDYLVKTRLDTDQLAHSIIFSMKRNTLIRQIQNGRLREQHIRRILELSFKSYSLSKLLKQALDLMLSVLPHAEKLRAGIYIAKENINTMLLIAHHNIPEHLLHRCGEIAVGTCMCGYSYETLRLVFHETGKRQTVKTKGIGIPNHYWVPVLHNQKLLGAIILFTEKRYDSGNRFENFLSSIAVSLAEVIESKHTTERLKSLAFFDTLTGLPNRNHFCHRLKHAIACAHRYKTKFALLFCDIDRFKSINDSLGHKAGDILLEQTASRLKTTVRESDIIARLSGDEFAIILTRINHEQEAALVARKICSSLNAPFLIMKNGCIITVSIGIAVFPADGQYMNRLLVNADTAMYFVKKHGKAAYHFYNPEMNKEADEYAKLETSLYEALHRDELKLYFQPEIDLATKQVVGVEALLRWQHPKRGTIYPRDFLGIAEKTGLIGQINEWVVDAVVAHLLSWQKKKLPALRFAFNISGHVLLAKEQLEKMLQVLSLHKLSTDLLEIEINENYLINYQDQMIKGIKEIGNLGIRFSINDFGSQYCSLKYLQTLPIYKLKIDKSFIAKFDTDKTNYSLVQSIISMGHSLGLKVIAEGVERKKQLDMLVTLRCDEAQGFFISKPLTEKDLIAYITKTRGR